MRDKLVSYFGLALFMLYFALAETLEYNWLCDMKFMVVP